MDELKKRLMARGLKPTYQRLKILEYLERHMDQHPTADIIYEALASRMPMLSMTTIYNTLNSFLKARLVSAITITGTEVRYDYTNEPHHHFLCMECGRIIDIDIKCPVAEKRTKALDGHKVEEVHGYFKGLCAKCFKKEKKAKQ